MEKEIIEHIHRLGFLTTEELLEGLENKETEETEEDLINQIYFLEDNYNYPLKDRQKEISKIKIKLKWN